MNCNKSWQAHLTRRVKVTRDQSDIIKAALDQPENLTEWEYDFINSLADEDEYYILSDKQDSMLSRIEIKLDL